MSCEHCSDGQWPQYGVAPHVCFWKIPGARIGESVLLPRDQWPSHFEEDPDEPGNGVWHCPHCFEQEARK